MIRTHTWIGGLAVAAVTATLLTGCGGGTPIADPTTPASSPSETPTSEPTPTSTPTPTPVVVAPADTTLTAQDAYASCIDRINFYYSSQIADGTFAPFGSSDVIARTDGQWYVYIEVTIPSATTPQAKNIAAECVLKPTVVPDEQQTLFGLRARAPLSERDPNSTINEEGQD